MDAEKGLIAHWATRSDAGGGKTATQFFSMKPLETFLARYRRIIESVRRKGLDQSPVVPYIIRRDKKDPGALIRRGQIGVVALVGNTQRQQSNPDRLIYGCPQAISLKNRQKSVYTHLLKG
jgi:hypothetical protein